MNNILSFDVEDYCHIVYRNLLGKEIEPSSGEVVKRTELILDTLDEFGCKATFFVVGKVAKRFPGLVQRIAECGHELGSHGYNQIYVESEDADISRTLISKAVQQLENRGASVVCCLLPKYQAFLDALRSEGFVIVPESLNTKRSVLIGSQLAGDASYGDDFFSYDKWHLTWADTDNV